MTRGPKSPGMHKDKPPDVSQREDHTNTRRRLATRAKTELYIVETPSLLYSTFIVIFSLG